MVDSATTAAFETVTSIASSTFSTSLAEWQSSVMWMIIAGFIIAFVLAFAVGANDVANSFGTAVGSGTLSLKQACVLASIFETLGAILLGAKVGHTIRKGIVDVDIYNGSQTLLMAGEISAMSGSGVWQLVATFLKLPVSGTHSIVGSTIGFSLVAKGVYGVNWAKLGAIVGSWFLSPILSGICASLFYILLRRLIFMKDDPISPTLIALPIMFGITSALNIFSVLFTGTKLLGFDRLSTLADLMIASSIGFLVAVLVQCVVVRKMKKKWLKGKDEEIVTKNLISENDVTLNELKRVKQPMVMETIKESNSLENIKSDSDEKENIVQPAKPQPINKDISLLNSKFNLEHSHNFKKLKEEARERRKAASKRSHSTGSGVRIPPVLQLEKSVVQSSAPVPSVISIRDEIRRNFSEPSMKILVQNSETNIYEVFVNRHKSMVTIQRRRTSKKLSESSSITKLKDTESLNEKEVEIDTTTPLEEAFDSSDEEEGLVMQTTSEKSGTGGYHGVYSEAIEEGFRYLSKTNQNVVAIKIDDPVVEENNQNNMTRDDKIESKENQQEVKKMFGFLQVLTACFGSFAHGGNDVSNAIGPLIALWIIYVEGEVAQKSSTPPLILFYGGVGICCGLWVWGRRVIKTMGEEITNLTPTRGFTIELTSALTVLIASNLGLPVSTTHCKVGAVVAVGWVRSRQAVDWKIFRNIVLAWFVTVPISGGLSAAIFACIRAIANLE